MADVFLEFSSFFMIQQMLAIWSLIPLPWVSLVVQMGNNPSARQESWVWSLGRITCWFIRAWAKTNMIVRRPHGASISDSPSFVGSSLRNPPPRFYDVVIYNKKCIFGLHLLFWCRSPKTLGTFVGEQLSSLVMWMGWLLDHMEAWGLVARRNNHVTRGFEHSVPYSLTSDLLGNEKSWRVRQQLTASHLINHDWEKQLPEKP